MTLVVEEKPFQFVFFVNASFKVMVSFDDFHANESQAIVGGFLHCELNGGVGFIKFTIYSPPCNITILTTSA